MAVVTSFNMVTFTYLICWWVSYSFGSDYNFQPINSSITTSRFGSLALSLSYKDAQQQTEIAGTENVHTRYNWQHHTALHYLSAQHQQASNVGYRQRLCSSSSAMLGVPRMWPSVAVHSVQLQLVCGTVCQRQCSLLSHWTFFDATWKLNCSCVLTTVKRLYRCVTHFHFHFPCSFLLWPQPWSLSTIMLLWHSFLIIIIITAVNVHWCLPSEHRWTPAA